MVRIVINDYKIKINDGYTINHEVDKQKYNEIIVKKIGTLDQDLLYFDIEKETNINIYISGKVFSFKCGHNDIYGNWGGLSPNKIGIEIESINYCRFLKFEKIKRKVYRICNNPIANTKTKNGILHLKCIYKKDYSDDWKNCERLRFVE